MKFLGCRLQNFGKYTRLAELCKSIEEHPTWMLISATDSKISIAAHVPPSGYQFVYIAYLAAGRTKKVNFN